MYRVPSVQMMRNVVNLNHLEMRKHLKEYFAFRNVGDVWKKEKTFAWKNQLANVNYFK